jgi:hypothetical protein
MRGKGILFFFYLLFSLKQFLSSHHLEIISPSLASLIVGHRLSWPSSKPQHPSPNCGELWLIAVSLVSDGFRLMVDLGLWWVSALMVGLGLWWLRLAMGFG